MKVLVRKHSFSAYNTFSKLIKIFL